MNTRPQPSAGKKTAFVIVLLIAPLFLLGVVELAGRGAVYLIYGVPNKSYGIYQADPVIGHFPAPNTYNHLTSLNDWGFRNIEDVITSRVEDAVRMIVYGGSTSFCPKLSTEACWPHQLEQRLRAGDSGAPHQVLNGGVVQWSLSHILERLKRDLPALKPDMVIIYSGINEPGNASFLRLAGTPIEKLVNEEQYGVAAANYPASDWLALNSILYKVARGFIVSGQRQMFPGDVKAIAETKDIPSKIEVEARPLPDPAVLKNYLVVLDRVIKLIRKHGAEPVFVIQAGREPATVLEYSKIGALTACRLGVRGLDAREAVASYPGPNTDLFTSSIHFSAKGAAVMADYLYDRLYRRKGFSVCDKRGT